PLSLTQIEQVKALDFNEIINKPILPSRFTNQLHSAWERHLKNDKTFKAVATSMNLTTKLPSPSTPSDKHQVLLVEDNAVVRKITRLLLEKLDCEVDIAVNGEEALTLSRAKVYDLVFLDIDLPDIDGISVCRALRANSGPNQNSTLVALTGQIVEKEAKICLAAGMNAFLEKPASSTNFMRIIQQFIVDKPELA
ncbi:MAG TPA: response regulator, partial [Coxiellaceae bacterium]|nr:response regulator [Coxiellaceae bacterium]